jgi:hypothetical protein
MLNLLLSLKILFCKIFSSPVFIIEIKKGKVTQVKGAKVIKFVHECEDIAKENNLSNGLIYAVKNSGGKARIKTSSEIPSGVAQRLRNVWSFYA